MHSFVHIRGPVGYTTPILMYRHEISTPTQV